MEDTNASALANSTATRISGACLDSQPAKTTAIVAYLLLMILSLVGNTMVIAVFYRNSSLRNPVDIFLVNMSISDLLVPVFQIPLRMSWVIIGAGRWTISGGLGSMLCKLVPMTEGVSRIVSVVSMVVIASERFHSTVFVMKPPMITKRVYPILIAVTWVFGFVFHAHYFFAYRLVQMPNKKQYCLFLWQPMAYRMLALKIEWIVSFVCFTAIPVVTMAVLYSSVALALRRQRHMLPLSNEILRKRAETKRRINCMLVIIVVAFFLVITPFHVNIGLFITSAAKPPCIWKFIADYLPMTYTLINPIVYFVFNQSYRKGFVELLTSLGRCCAPCRNCTVCPNKENRTPLASLHADDSSSDKGNSRAAHGKRFTDMRSTGSLSPCTMPMVCTTDREQVNAIPL